MTSSILQRIEAMLYDRIGLDPTTVGSSLVERAVKRRMLVRRVETTPAYATLLSGDALEVQELVEEVVIPETYFFREPEALDAIAARISNAGGDRTVQILSAPCSTGEEPYSIAMTLLAAGIAPERIVIDAVDVSREATRRARAAVYRKNAFRGAAESWMRFFDTDGEEHTLQQRVRGLVKIVQANLLDPAFDPPRLNYDIIFCRNLLIYFDTGTQARVLETLAKILAPGGLLVVGAADTFAVRRAGFAPLSGAERSFLFVRSSEIANDDEAVEAPVRKKVRPRVPATVKPRVAPKAKRVAMRPAESATAVPAMQAEPSIMSLVVAHADAGRIDEALRVGERALELDAANAELHALVGTLYSSKREDARAEQSYRRALYIDPENADALAHLAALVEHRGDVVAAARLRARAQRAHAGGAA